MGIRQPLIMVCTLLMAASTAWAQYYVSPKSLGKDGRYTQNKERTYIVAGCLPLDIPKPSGWLGSSYVRCNDLKYVKSKVIETDFVGCKNLVANGVVSSITVEEFKKRKWSSFKFGCRAMGSDGKLTGAEKMSKTLFNYSKKGTNRALGFDRKYLPIGITEQYHKLQLKESLMTLGINLQTASTIYDEGVAGKRLKDYAITKFIPSIPNPPIGLHDWNCPAGKVLTGLAVGHIPQRKKKYTRPVYLLGECRSILKMTASPAKIPQRRATPSRGPR